MLAANAAATLNNAARLGLTEEGGDELAATARQQALADQQRGEVGRGLATIGDLSTAFLTGDPTAGAARIADLTSQDVRDMKANTVLEAQATEHFQNQLEQFKSYYTKLMPTVPQGTVDNLAEMAAQNSYRNFMRAGSAGTQVRSGRQTNRHLGGDDQFAQLANQLGRQIGQASLLRKDDEGNFSGVLQDPGVRQALEMAAQRGELPQPPETPQHVYYSDR
jgi:hypothetical protein